MYCILSIMLCVMPNIIYDVFCTLIYAFIDLHCVICTYAHKVMVVCICSHIPTNMAHLRPNHFVAMHHHTVFPQHSFTTWLRVLPFVHVSLSVVLIATYSYQPHLPSVQIVSTFIVKTLHRRQTNQHLSNVGCNIGF